MNLPEPVFTRIVDGEGDVEEVDDVDVDGDGNGDDEEVTAEDNVDGKPASKKAKQSKAAGTTSTPTNYASTSTSGQRSHDGPKPIRVLLFHPNKNQPWFIFNSEEKYLHLYHRHKSYETGFKHVLT